MRNPLVLIGGAALVVLVLVLLFASGGGGNARLDNSVMGTNGLGQWLSANRIPLTRSSGRSTAPREDLSIALLPLYDTNLNARSREAESDAQRMADTSPREAQGWIVQEMQAALPMLTILPKWRNGFALTGIAHEQTQIPPDDVHRVFGQLGLGGARLIAVQNRIVSGRLEGVAALQGRQIALFRPQLFDRMHPAPGCTEIAGLPEGALILACRLDSRGTQKVTWYLSDPDVLNNHGLRLADNAGFTLDLVNWMRGEDSRRVLLAQGALLLDSAQTTTQPHKRTAEDLSRFFAWPLSALWAMAGTVLLLALWRGARRFGPARSAGAGGLDQSRRAAITAKARLLRLSGADARMASEHVRAHLADLATQSLGPGAGNDPGIARWFALLERRNAELAGQIRAAADRITPDTSPADLPRLIETFHALTRKASDAA